MYEKIHIAIPIHVNNNDIKLIVSSISSGPDLEVSNESITFPMRKTNDGLPQPAIPADTHPIAMRVLSALEANE